MSGNDQIISLFPKHIKSHEISKDTKLTDKELKIKANKSFNIKQEINKRFTCIVGSRSLAKKKLDQQITLDTKVYRISGAGLGENKNYNKISEEIEKFEQMEKTDKVKLLEKINESNKGKYNVYSERNLLSLQNKKLLMIEYEKEHKFNFFEVCQKLKIPPEKRTIRDILMIKKYIEQTKMALDFKEEFPDIKTAEKLINLCCIEMCYKHFKKGTIIMKIGDTPDYFYTIISGKINILKPLPKQVLLTGFQYFKYLMNIRKKKDHYLFNLCIKNNRNNYYIESNVGEIIHYIYLLIYFKKLRFNSDPNIDLDKVLDLLDITPEELGIDPNLVTSNYYISDNLKKIMKKIPRISVNIIDQYSFIWDSLIRREITIYEYKIFLSLQTNDYFGDVAIESNSHRNATIIAAEDTYIAYLTNKLYSTKIATEKAAILQQKINNLHRSNFFIKININKFSKNYFCFFISKKYYKGDKLFNEGDNLKYLYFIEEGSVELTVNKTVNEITKIIYLIEKNKQIFKKKNFEDILVNKENEKDIDNETVDLSKKLYNYLKMDLTEDDIDKCLNEKHFNKIIILNNKEDIGIVSHFLGHKYFCTCKVISNNAKIYKIEIDYFNEILTNEKEILSDFCVRLKKKMDLINKILYKITQVKIIMTDEKIIKNTLDQKEVEEKDVINNNSARYKLLVDYEKINNLLNQQKDNNNTNINSNNKRIKSKNKIIKLPIVKNLKKMNLFNTSIGSFNVKEKFGKRNKSIKINKLIKKKIKFDGLQNLKMISQKPKLFSQEKSTQEDIEIEKIKRDLINFSKDKKNVLNHKFKFIFDRNRNFLKNNDSPVKSQEPVYITELSNINSPNIKKTEQNDGDLNETKYYSYRQIFQKLSKSPSPFKKINEQSSRDTKRYNYRTFSNDYRRVNTEKNINRGNGNSESKKENKFGFYNKYDRPYYEPLTLIKKEKYKIFERENTNNNNNKVIDEYFESDRKRVRILKIMHLFIRNKCGI